MIRNLAKHVLVAALIVSTQFAANATKTWQGGGVDNDWNTAANWLPNGAPANTDDVVLDNSSILTGGYTVVIGAADAASVKSLKIGYTGNTNPIILQITTTTAGTPLTIAGDGNNATDDLVVFENARLEMTWSTAGSTLSNGTGNTNRIKANGYLYFNTSRSFSTPFGTSGNGATTFEPGSTVEAGPLSVQNFPISGRTYGNLLLNRSGLFSNTASSPLNIQNTLTVGAGSSVNWTLTSAGGTMTFNNIANNGAGVTVGTVNAAGIIWGSSNGTLNGSGTNGLTVASGAFGSLTLAGALTIASGKSMTVSGQTVTANAGITDNGTLNCDTAAILGSGNFTVGSGATLGIKNTGGLETAGALGQIQMAGTRTYNTGANYVFNGSSAQATGGGFPATVNNLTINNAAGVSMNNALAVSAQLSLQAGPLTTNGNALTVPDGGAVSTGGYVVGTITQSLNAANTGTRVFPVGTAGAASNVMLTITTPGSGSGNVAVSATAAPNTHADSATSLQRFWVISPSTSFTLDPSTQLSLAYQAADVPGTVTESSMIAGEWTGSTWNLFPNTASTPGVQINAGTHVATITGVTGFSEWTLGASGSLPVGMSSFGVE